MFRLPAFFYRRSKALVLGRTGPLSVFPRYRVSEQARTAHLYIIGLTGKGKSKLLEHCLAQDIAAGRGCVLIDPHSDRLFRQIADTWLGPIEDDPLNDYDCYASREEAGAAIDRTYLDQLNKWLIQTMVINSRQNSKGVAWLRSRNRHTQRDITPTRVDNDHWSKLNNQSPCR